MARGKVRKGFFFYLMIFLILIVAFVGVCVVIMLFSPGKSVLGFQYFSNSAGYQIVKTTDASESEINLGKRAYDNIIIDAGPAEVIFENNQDYDKNCIMIINKSKGFARDGDIKPFEYSVEIVGNDLVVKVESSDGFLNFSKDIKVRVHMADISAENQQDILESFKNTNFKVETTTGNVIIGGALKKGYSTDIYPGSLDISTGSGNITLTSHASETYKKVSLSTKSGIISLTDKEKIEATEDNVKIDVGSGKLRAKVIKDNLDLMSKKGTIEVGEVTGDTSVSARTAILDINKVGGNLNFEKGSEVMSDSKVYIDEVGGFVNVLEGRDTDFYLGKIGGAVNIHTTSGLIRLGSEENLLLGSVYAETTSGKIDAFFGSSLNSRFLVSENGSVNAYFGDAIKGTLNTISSKKGNVSVKFKSDAKAEFMFDVSDPSDEKKFDLGKVKFDLLQNTKLSSNPYYFNCSDTGTNAQVKIITDKTVTLDLI